MPYFDRYHTTIAPGDTTVSTSRTESIGDIRAVGRYQGFTDDRSIGVQAGLKFANGSIDNKFIDGRATTFVLDPA